MPATSKAQQQAAGAALAAKKKGTTSGLKGASKAMAKMSKTELEKIASTKHKGLPKHVKESITMEEPMEETHMMGQEHPGCEDKVGQICVVLRPSPESSPEELVHPTHAFGMGQFDPSTIHGIYNDEKEANLVAEAICSELQQHLAEVEKKKAMVTEKIDKAIKGLQKEVNRCMDEGDDMRAQEVLQRIAELRNKHSMVEASKKEIKPTKDEE